MNNPAGLLALLLISSPHPALTAPPAPPLEALVSATGVITVRDGSAMVAVIEPGFYLSGWSRKSPANARPTGEKSSVSFLDLGDNGKIRFEASATRTGEALELHYAITPSVSLLVETAHVSVLLPAGDWIGATASSDSGTTTVPPALNEVVLLGGATRRFTLGPSATRPAFIDITLPGPGNVALQDSRKWSPELEIRLTERPGSQAWAWNANETKKFDLVVGFGRRLRVIQETPVTIRAGRDWVPLSGSQDIVPYTAIDFGGIVPRFPAGVAGRILPGRNKPGIFELEKRSGIPMPFYGVNLCYSAQFLSMYDADRLAERFMHIGYNSVRIHHYESVPWTPGSGVTPSTGPDSTILKGENLDKLEFLVSALKKRGIYTSIDLYVNRSVRSAEVFPGTKGDLAFRFKTLVQVSDRALENWKVFARALLTHVNPYTGLAWKDDPAVAFISLMNEDNLANDPSALQTDPLERELWEKAWNRWPRRSGKPDWDSPLFRRFLWETQQATIARMSKFLREELGVKALLTGVNGWTDEWGTQACRAGLDYVDNHWYWDHPVFLENEWALPSKGGSGSGSAIAAAGAGREKSFSRLFDRPFAVSEFNHTSTNRFAGESGLLAGAYASIQGWAGLWRFTYSQDRESIMSGAASNYFDMVADPLLLASERVGMALFLRGDLTEAPGAFVITGSPEDFLSHPGTSQAGDATRLGWCVRLGSLVSSTMWGPGWLDQPVAKLPAELPPTELLGILRQKGLLSATNATDPKAGIYESAGGEVRLETGPGIMAVNTARTVALAGPAGTSRKLGPVSIGIGKTWAMVSVISLDGAPLSESGKILVTHLTDLKNTGERFRDASLTVLEDWGQAPWLVRSGRASIRIGRARKPASAEVWRLSLAGQRTAKLPADIENGVVSFTPSISPEEGATLDYEVAITP